MSLGKAGGSLPGAPVLPAPAAPAVPRGWCPPSPVVRERRAAAGREALAPASPVTLRAPPVALPFVNIFVFFFYFFALPLRSRRAPGLAGWGVAGGWFGAVPRDVQGSAEGAQLLRILCVVPFSYRLCANVFQHLGFLKVPEKVQESFTNSVLKFD